MIRVTWEWLGQAPALDLANTVTIEDGEEHDLLGSPTDYERWARSEAEFLPQGSLRLLEQAQPQLLRLRTTVRGLLADVTADERPRVRLVEQLNRVSRDAPQWLVLDPTALSLREESSRPVDKLVADYARSAMEVLAGQLPQIRRCPATSCGMFYLSNRAAQRWCSTQCGTRARVARHYSKQRGRSAS